MVQAPRKFVPKFSSLSRDTSRGQIWRSYSHWPQSYSLKYAEFCAKFLILAFPQKNLGGGTQVLDLTCKAPPSLHHLAKFRGDWPKGLRDFAPKPFAPKNVLG